jgi:hypothetical protein
MKRLIERIADDPVPTALRLLAVCVAILGLLLITACASPRYLTEKEDADMRKVCEPAGCVTVPAPVWMKIETVLRSMMGA